MTAARQAWDGYFINLDRSADRRRHMERQVASLGIANRYRRFPAVDGTKIARTSSLSRGEVGVYRSHLNLWERAAAEGRTLHIMEDDVALCDLTAPAIDLAVQNRVVDEYDILFLEFMPTQSIPTVRRLRDLYLSCTERTSNAIDSPSQLKIININDLYLWGSTSYLVGSKNAARLLSVLNEEWRRGPALPFDRAIEMAARTRRIRLGSFFPFISTIDLGQGNASTAG